MLKNQTNERSKPNERKKDQLWKFHEKTGGGSTKIFDKPTDLWAESMKYFRWCDSNPLKEQKILASGKKVNGNKLRPYTIKGLCLFLNIGERTWNRYQKREEFAEMCEKIADIIFTQKFEGAAAGFFSANIIARDLGLKDASDVTTNGKELKDAFAASVARAKQRMNKESGNDSN
jgi:hypothetical protein